ncbi:MAG TPA: fibronectin type III domain-containing protein, partial [Woeseiaceae bacterium]
MSQFQSGVVIQPSATPTYIRGSDGLSAYELAARNGFSGTEAEWVAQQAAAVTDAELAAAVAPKANSTDVTAALATKETPAGAQEKADAALAAAESSLIQALPSKADATTVTALATRVTTLEEAPSGTAGDGQATVFSVSRLGHGFLLGETIRAGVGGPVRSQANNATNAKRLGTIIAVLDVDTVRVATGGIIDTTGWLVEPLTTYYLSATSAGGYTSVAPAAPNLIVPLFETNEDGTKARIYADSPSANVQIEPTDLNIATLVAALNSNGGLTAGITDLAATLVSVFGSPLLNQVLGQKVSGPSGIGWVYPVIEDDPPATPSAPTLVGKTQSTIEVEVAPVTGAAGYVWYLDTVQYGEPTIDPTVEFTGLDPETSYSITVSAINSAGASAQSTALVEETDAVPDTTPPTAPDNLTATDVTSTSQTINWDASTDNVAVSHYIVKRGGVTIAAEVTDLFYADSGLTPSTPYTYQV